MVKSRPGSRKGQTRWNPSAYKAAKKRAGQLGKSTAQKKAILHDAMRDTWDEGETPSTNLKRLGLLSSINKVSKSAITTKRTVSLTNDGDQRMDDNDGAYKKVRKELERHAGMKEQGTKQVVRPGEQLALQRLVRRYGDNWSKMSRDITMNYLQWTPDQLRKKIERMNSLLASKKK